MEKTLLKAVRAGLIGLVLGVLSSCGLIVDDAVILLGNYSYLRGDYQRANLHYLSLLGDPQYTPWVLYNLGNVYTALGESSTALEVWDEIRGDVYDELEFRLTFNRGHLLYQKGLYQDSYGQFKKALRLRPRSLDAKRNLELTLQKIQALTDVPNLTQEGPSDQPGKTSGATMLEYVKQIESTRWKSNRTETKNPPARDW